eukprot:1730262-Lingulodinium_polyedra.AAC.1
MEPLAIRGKQVDVLLAAIRRGHRLRVLEAFPALHQRAIEGRCKGANEGRCKGANEGRCKRANEGRCT